MEWAKEHLCEQTPLEFDVANEAWLQGTWWTKMPNKHQFKSLAQLSESEWFKSFDGESDRGTVLLVAELLSTALELLLKHVMPNEKGNLFNSNEPLANFSARIDVASAFGLISEEVCRDLHLIRKIRNDFAHGISAMNFDSQSVVNRIGEFRVLKELTAADTGNPIPELEGTIFGGQREPLGNLLDTNRKQFMYEFMMLLPSIECRGQDVGPLPTFEQWHEEYDSRPDIERRSILSQLLGD